MQNKTWIITSIPYIGVFDPYKENCGQLSIDNEWATPVDKQNDQKKLDLHLVLPVLANPQDAIKRCTDKHPAIGYVFAYLATKSGHKVSVEEVNPSVHSDESLLVLAAEMPFKLELINEQHKAEFQGIERTITVKFCEKAIITHIPSGIEVEVDDISFVDENSNIICLSKELPAKSDPVDVLQQLAAYVNEWKDWNEASEIQDKEAYWYFYLDNAPWSITKNDPAALLETILAPLSLGQYNQLHNNKVLLTFNGNKLVVTTQENWK